MNRSISYNIPEDKNNLKLSDFLKEKGISTSLIIQLKYIEEGILVNGVRALTNHILKTNDLLTLNFIEKETNANIEPTEIPLNIVYEDEDILVIDKPAGMPVHPSQNHHTYTLANALAFYYKDSDSSHIFRCVNRLDKDTTGLVLLAKNMLSSCILSAQIRERSIHREYLAVVTGQPSPSGTISVPIGRVADSTIERGVDLLNGEHAVTHYECLSTGPQYSLLKITLETGRTHQIRVHMKHMGHPLPGDFLYHPDMKHIKRQALHSHRLTFSHPITGVPLSFTSPLPEDMERLLRC